MATIWKTMGSNLREQLLGTFPEGDIRRIFYSAGRKCPPHNRLNPIETYKKFKKEFLPRCPLTDRLDREIRIEDTNFPKLLNLEHKRLGEAARAYLIVEEFEKEMFNAGDYAPIQSDRIETLFWIPDVIGDPDAIFKNNHRIVKADEVMVYVYDKAGSRIKLVFTAKFGPKFNPRYEIVTVIPHR